MESAVFLEMLPGYAIIKSRWPDIVGIGGEKVAGTPYIVTRGVVLRETETRDADKILTVLTAEQGKIAVIARGARRKSCKFCRLRPAAGLFGVDALQKGRLVLR